MLANIDAHSADRDVVQHILVVSESDTANNEQGSLVMKDPSSLVEKLCYYLVESAAEEVRILFTLPCPG